MTKEKKYPLHPGQTHAEPYYTQVPTEEYEANMRELKQIRELTAGSRTTIDDIAEIKTLTSEVNALREMNVKLQGEKIQLEDDVALLRKNNEKLRKENESLKQSVEMLDTDLNMGKFKKDEIVKNTIEKIKQVEELDGEDYHKKAYRILCDVLNEIGFGEIVRKYDSRKKWYA